MDMDNKRVSASCEIIKMKVPTPAPTKDCWWCRQSPQCQCLDWREIRIKKLRLPCNVVLKHPIFYVGLAKGSKATGKSRRDFISHMTSILYCDNYKFFESDGVTEFKLLLCSVYTAFKDDEDFRWLSDFFETTLETRKLNASDELLPRLKLITYTFMIENFEFIKNLENEVLENIRKRQSSKKIQMIWCASFAEKTRRYDLEVMNNGEAEVSVFENNILEKRIRLQTAPEKWDIDVAKSLNLIK